MASLTWDGLAVALRVLRIPKTSSPADGGVHVLRFLRFRSPEKDSPLSTWVTDPKLLQSARDRVEKRLWCWFAYAPVLGQIDACVSRVNADCVAAGARRRHILLTPQYPLFVFLFPRTL